MGKVFGSVASALSLLAAVLLSPYPIGAVEWFVGRFPTSASWLRPVVWVLLGAGVFLCCLLLSYAWEKIGGWRSSRAEKAALVRQGEVLDHVRSLVREFSKQMSRFYTELSQESSPDSEALSHHMETDEMCYRLLNIIRYGPNVSLQDLSDGYETERELVDTTVQHYEVELRHELRAQRTERQRISAATYGAKCVDLLAFRIARGLAAKRAALRPGG